MVRLRAQVSGPVVGAPMLVWEGRRVRSIVHRIAAVVFMAVALTHVISLLANRRLRRHWKGLLPKAQDAREALAIFGYNVGLADGPAGRSRPQLHREGGVLGGGLGRGGDDRDRRHAMGHRFAMAWFPKSVLDVATSVHFYEARAGHAGDRGLALLYCDLRSRRLSDGHRGADGIQRAARVHLGSGRPPRTPRNSDHQIMTNSSSSAPSRLTVASGASVQQLDQPDRRGHRHHGYRVLAFLLPTTLRRRRHNPYIGILVYLLLPAVFFRRPASDSAGDLVRRRRERRTGRLPTSFPPLNFRNLELRRMAALHWCHHLRQRGDRRAAHLQRRQLHGYRKFLRPDLPHGDAAGIHGISEIAAFARGVRAVPHRPGGRWFVRSKLSGVRQVFAVTFNTYSAAHPDAGAQPAPGARDL